jgi:hypothetical protein
MKNTPNWSKTTDTYIWVFNVGRGLDPALRESTAGQGHRVCVFSRVQGDYKLTTGPLPTFLPEQAESTAIRAWMDSNHSNDFEKSKYRALQQKSQSPPWPAFENFSKLLFSGSDQPDHYQTCLSIKTECRRDC